MREQVQLIGLTPEHLCELIAESVKTQIKEFIPFNGTNSHEEQNEFLTRAETAELFKVSLPTIHDWQKNGILRVYKMGNRSYYKRSELLQTLYNSNLK